MIGIDILKVYREEELPAQVVMISAVGQESVINEGMSLGGQGLHCETLYFRKTGRGLATL